MKHATYRYVKILIVNIYEHVYIYIVVIYLVIITSVLVYISVKIMYSLGMGRWGVCQKIAERGIYH